MMILRWLQNVAQICEDLWRKQEWFVRVFLCSLSFLCLYCALNLYDIDRGTEHNKKTPQWITTSIYDNAISSHVFFLLVHIRTFIKKQKKTFDFVEKRIAQTQELPRKSLKLEKWKQKQKLSKIFSRIPTCAMLWCVAYELWPMIDVYETNWLKSCTWRGIFFSFRAVSYSPNERPSVFVIQNQNSMRAKEPF